MERWKKTENTNNNLFNPKYKSTEIMNILYLSKLWSLHWKFEDTETYFKK